MTPRFTIDQSGLDKQIHALEMLLKKKTTEVVDHAARVCVDACWRLTPPNATKHPMSEGTKASQRQGHFAVSEDLQRVFTFPGPDGIQMADRANIRTSKVARNFWRYVGAGRFSAATAVLRSQGIYVDSVVTAPSFDYHQKQRNSRGRVRRKGVAKQLVTDRSKIKAYIKRTQKRVGYARSGWKKAVDALRCRDFPAWARKHSGGGIFQRGGTPDAPTVTFGNAVPYIQRAGTELRVMPTAFKITRNKLEAEMKVLMAKAKGTFQRAGK